MEISGDGNAELNQQSRSEPPGSGRNQIINNGIFSPKHSKNQGNVQPELFSEAGFAELEGKLWAEGVTVTQW